MPDTIQLFYAKRPNGSYAAVDTAGRVLATGREPLFAAARALIAEGHDPDTPLTIQHQGSAIVSLRYRLGRAAELAVSEGQHPPKLHKWSPFIKEFDHEP